MSSSNKSTTPPLISLSAVTACRSPAARWQKNQLHRVIEVTQQIVGCPPPSPEELQSSCLRNVEKLHWPKRTEHLPSGRRLRSIETNGLRNSFYPSAACWMLQSAKPDLVYLHVWNTTLSQLWLRDIQCDVTWIKTVTGYIVFFAIYFLIFILYLSFNWSIGVFVHTGELHLKSHRFIVTMTVKTLSLIITCT